MIRFINSVPFLKTIAMPFYYVLFSWKNKYFSQAGEDVIVSYLFKSVNKKQVSYLDIGANDPIAGSNTYLFYGKNNKGVCVEANPKLAKAICFYRPKDVCLNIAISTAEEQVLDFYVFDSHGLSTLSREEALSREKFGSFKIKEIIKIRSQRINTVIAENFESYPDFLSIDIEGLDLDVLQSLDFNLYPIPAICVETVSYAENHLRQKDYSIEEFLLQKGYFKYADTFINTLFVNEKWYREFPIGSSPRF